jgi:hypothetical protein
MHAEAALFAQQSRYIAVWIVDVAEMQGVRDAELHMPASPEDRPRREAVFDPKIHPVRTNVHFCATPKQRDQTFNFILRGVVGKMRFMNEKPRLIRTSDSQ